MLSVKQNPEHCLLLNLTICASHIVNAIKNDNPIITHIAPVMLATRIQPITMILKITKPGRI